MQAEPVSIEEHNASTRYPNSKWRRVMDAITDAQRVQEYSADYQALTYAALYEKYQEYFGDLNEHQARGIILRLRDHWELPTKRPAVSDAMTGKKRVTPQTLDQVFKPGASVPPDQAMQALANALLPYLRDALLDDLATSIQVVRTARGNG